MQIGERIRFYRIQQNKTQEELAGGIISVPYLSKIENNQSLPSLEVIEQLCARLGVRFLDEQEPNLLEEVTDWYKFMTSKGKEGLSEASQQYEVLRFSANSSNDSKAVVYFMLFELRYFLLTNQIEEAEASIVKVEEILDLLNAEQSYYLWKFKGLRNYLKENFEGAYDCFKRAEMILIHNVFEKWEEADLCYSLGLSSSRLWKVSLSISYATRALAIYQAQYNYRRSAECQILLGINYQRSEEYEKAEESYLLCSKIADTLEKFDMKGLVHHNIGYLRSVQEDYNSAIVHFLKSYNYYVDGNHIRKIHAIDGLVQAYYELNNHEEGLEWVQEGARILEENNLSLPEYEIKFKVYNFLMDEEMESAKFEKYMREEAIPYFEDHRRNDLLAKHAEFLAEHYFRHTKYKSATKYYQISVKALKKVTHVD
ncbi:helix-turn-helix domain-containing protein [Bacillus fonticola]|uniref:helix-turn-helix domain-containing protein n=1 Tax=Bacillus fonticola TaxID=2728853 RepID=UPI00147389FB|nr:helix-turn-helix transcriptional regulator [Bacillus fonticola]